MIPVILLPMTASAVHGQTRIDLYKQELVEIDKQLAKVEETVKTLNNPAGVELEFLHEARERAACRLRVVQAAGVVFGMPSDRLSVRMAEQLDEMDEWLDSEQVRQEQLDQARRQADHLRELRAALLSLIANQRR